MKNTNRRLNEQAREIIANALLFDISDPRLDLVTITDCEVSSDKTACNVYYTAQPDRYDDVKAAFEQAKGCIRSNMASKLSWRQAPELRFILDTSVDNAQQVDALLKADRERNVEDASSSSADEESEI